MRPPLKPPATTPSDTNSPAAKSTNDLIQLSFQGANIDMIAQWLAETTGKNVIKHPQAQCQITIFGSKKVSRGQAVTMVYHALEVEGFTAIESAQLILIVPEGKEPKMSPEYDRRGQTAAAGGHEREVRVFTLQYAQADELKDKVKTVLTEKATVETDEHANALVITDFHDNVAVAAELIRALDIDRHARRGAAGHPFGKRERRGPGQGTGPTVRKAQWQGLQGTHRGCRQRQVQFASGPLQPANFKLIEDVIAGRTPERRRTRLCALSR